MYREYPLCLAVTIGGNKNGTGGDFSPQSKCSDGKRDRIKHLAIKNGSKIIFLNNFTPMRVADVYRLQHLLSVISI